MDEHAPALDRAAAAIAAADALLIGAGAGMGVDSGLPDFRGDAGFWRAYPAAQRLGMRFGDLANPRWFRDDPPLAWGFYGHRLGLYRATAPHPGFALLRRWAAARPRGAFVFTSNVDGHFQRAGFDPARVLEVHGAIDRLQCTAACGAPLWPAPPGPLRVDPDTLRAAPPLPACPRCGALARPNILMFGDTGWDATPSLEQEDRFHTWLDDLHEGGARLVVVECGAGRAIPTVRWTCERAARLLGGLLVRLNPRDPHVPEGHLSLPLPALAALQAIDARLPAA